MKITFEFYEKLPDSAVQSLWAQDICMDDWDYVLFFEDADLFEHIDSYRSRDFSMTLQPKSTYIDKLLSGYSSNKWYPIGDFMGRRGILGVAYHG